MQFMTALFGGPDDTLLNSAFALGIVLVLIVLAAWVLKLFTGGAGMKRKREHRLEVVDTATVDGRRRVILIRRDNVEHMILTGGPQDLVIESGIAAPEPIPRNALPPRRPAPARPVQPAAVEEPATAEQPVPREAVDRLRDLARPAPLGPLGPRSPLRHTPLLRPASREPAVIPMSPDSRTDNSTGGKSDSATSNPIEGGGYSRVGGGNRFFRSGIRSDRT